MSELATIEVRRSIGYADALAALREAVAVTGPDYIYPEVAEVGCTYVTADGRPSCLVGRVFHRLGVSINMLKRWDDHEMVTVTMQYTPGPEGSYEADLPDLPVLDHATYVLLNGVQELQDRGVPWGPAVTEAIGRVSRTLVHA